ncbi:hypothetical protein F5Y16DRAFT_370862 [Xylariaceae sp. FL0255]|nr:hypothetical protein F5Y16DRAFT_370862 [Xylariaceae sp. FL0255]
MDDPWGSSPWASADAPAKNDTAPSPDPSNTFQLNPPPKVFFGNATGQLSQSPWATDIQDDDAFGSWSTAERADPNDNQTEWGVWGETNLQIPRPSPRLSVSSSKDGSLAWPGNVATSPGLRPLSRSRSPSLFRHHSPDPWAAEVSLNNGLSVEILNNSNESLQTRPDNTNIPILASASPSIPSSKTAVEAEQSSAEGKTPLRVNSDDTATEPSIAEPREIIVASLDAAEEPKLESGAHEYHSRSPSTISIDSHAGIERQDSPITSIDEDRGARLGAGSRKTSGKVHELVGIYDSLTKAASEEPPSVGSRDISQIRSRETSRARSEQKRSDDDGDDDEGDFGVFENGEIAADEPKSESPVSNVSPQRASNKPEHQEQEGDALSSPTRQDPDQIRSILEKFGDITFHPDLSLIDKLFPDAHDSLNSNDEQTPEISDNIIWDSFTSISERKAWYRISRFGSMRKHNSGDDDNYHRVTWPTSHLHGDTIKIVRRWMEEDTYSGRAVLGGSKRTGFFDWDSNAAPITLAEVFRRKPSISKGHSRTLSTPTNNTTTAIPSYDKQPSRSSTGISLPSADPQTASPTVKFSWASNNEPLDACAQQAPVSTSNVSPAPVPPLTFAQPSAQHAIPDEDEDDWGEMVSSLVIDTMPEHSPISKILEPPKSSHKTTSSLPVNVLEVASHGETSKVNHLHQGPSDITNSNPSTVTSEQPPPASRALDDWDFSSFEDPKPPPQSNDADKLPENTVVHASDSLPTQATAWDMGGPPIITKTPTVVSALRDDEGEDAVVQHILQNLPDFSYMFR